MDELQDIQQAVNETEQKINFLADKFTLDTAKYIVIGVLIFFIFVLLRKKLTSCILKILSKFTIRDRTDLNRKLVTAFEGPVRGMFVIIGIYFGLLFLGKAFGRNIYAANIVINLFKSVIIILISTACYNLTKEHSVLYEELSEIFNIKLDKIIFPFISKIFQIVIIGLALCTILAVWNYNINGFVAGLGVGGAALALAAKDALSNIFGGFVIILDKPFSIGDYIKTANVEGIVEDISIRSTRIRTLDKALVTEPNSTLANSSIINWTKRNMRRIHFILGVTYDTPKEKLKACVENIRQMLIDDPEINDETILVYFDGFNSSSLDIFIYCFTNTAEWDKYMEVKQNVNFKIMDILNKEGVSAAFPSTSIYFETPLINQKLEK